MTSVAVVQPLATGPGDDGDGPGSVSNRRPWSSTSAEGRDLTAGVVDVVSVMAVAVTVALVVVVPASASAMALPIALVAALVGIPHGAAGAAILATTSPGAGRRAGRAYLVAFLAVTAALWAATVPAVLALLVLAVAHFGLGEVEYTETRHTHRRGTRCTDQGRG